MRSAAAIGALVLLSIAPVSAYPVQGIGSSSCGVFASDYRKDPEIWEGSYFAWAQGYMSGLNMSSVATGNRPRELAGDYSVQKQKLRVFCDQFPLKSYMNAVIDLWKTLPPTN